MAPFTYTGVKLNLNLWICFAILLTHLRPQPQKNPYAHPNTTMAQSNHKNMKRSYRSTHALWIKHHSMGHRHTYTHTSLSVKISLARCVDTFCLFTKPQQIDSLGVNRWWGLMTQIINTVTVTFLTIVHLFWFIQSILDNQRNLKNMQLINRYFS